MNEYPVTLNVQRPERFERGHALLRGVLLILFSMLVAFGWLVATIYVAFPLVALYLIGRRPADFQSEVAPRLQRWVHVIIAAQSYFNLLTDRFSLDRPEEGVRLHIRVTDATPTAGNAIMRLITSIPSTIALFFLGIAAIITGIIAGAFVFATETYPEPLYRFHQAVITWTARLLAYHASLTDEYPPFTLDIAPGSPTTPAAAPTDA